MVKERHGLRYTSEYRAWADMKDRCTNPNNRYYANYGGRGIKVCKRWFDYFVYFYEDMGIKPTIAHSLDRKDNDGNYEPSNCRWATKREQVLNRHLPKNNTSGYKGIYRDSRNGKWIARVSINGKWIRLGAFNDILEAVKIRTNYGISTNFKNSTSSSTKRQTTIPTKERYQAS